MNHTINDKIICMLSHAKLRKVFYGEALTTVVDLINLSPSILLDSDIPWRVWKGKYVSYNHLRVFGCKAFVHIHRDKRSKLDGKFKQCILFSYGRDDFCYRFWDPVDKKIVRSQDTIFLEDQTIEDINKKEKPKQVTHEFIDVEPEPSAKVVDHGGDVNTNLENVVDVLKTQVIEPTEQTPPPKPRMEPLLRRSTRETSFTKNIIFMSLCC